MAMTLANTVDGVYGSKVTNQVCLNTGRVFSKRLDSNTLSVFGVGRRTVGRGPGAAAAVLARPRRRPEVSPPPPTVRRRRSARSTTSRRPQNVGQRHVSPSAAHRSAFRAVSRILVTTSGELILLPVGGRHPIQNLGQRPLARYSDFDTPPSSSRTYPAYRTFQVQNGG